MGAHSQVGAHTQVRPYRGWAARTMGTRTMGAHTQVRPYRGWAVRTAHTM